VFFSLFFPLLPPIGFVALVQFVIEGFEHLIVVLAIAVGASV
jgi:hypothetical protein